MPCYYPIKAWRSKELTANGKRGLVFKEEKGIPLSLLQIPCGRCIGCKLERSRQSAVRCMHEAKMHSENCFITLTYSPEYEPQGKTLDKADLQKFIKRLRKFYAPKKIRYYACGEYGEKFDRPHYHICIFGHDFADKKLWQDKNGYQLFTSATLEKIWPFGYSTIGPLTFETAAYTARYVLKKQNGDNAIKHYEYIDSDTGEIFDREPEFNRMSLKPGIGDAFFRRYTSDIYPSDQVITRGFPSKPPRFYDTQFERINPLLLTEVKKTRVKKAKRNKQDSTHDRLMAREQCAKARVKRNQREL